MTIESNVTPMQHILYEQHGAVARIWLAREKAANAQNTLLLQELYNCVERANDDDEVRCIIIGGKGKHFSSGHDLREGDARPDTSTVEKRWQHENRYYLDYSLQIWDSPKPVIAQVQGACIAGGFMVANSCDMIIASDDAFFSDPVLHSLAIAGVEVLFHPWVMNHRKAKEFLLTGMRLTAQEALDLGMVNRVVPRDQLEDEALKLAQTVAAAPAFAARMVKRSINRTLDNAGMRESIKSHFDVHQLCHAADAHQDLVRDRGDGANLVDRGKVAMK